MCGFDEYGINTAPCGNMDCFHYRNHLGLVKCRFDLLQGLGYAIVGAFGAPVMAMLPFAFFGINFEWLWIPAVLWGVSGFLVGMVHCE